MRREVDVNVHPAKAEVRFRNAGLVRALIVHLAQSGAGARKHARGDHRRLGDHRGVPAGGRAAARLGLAAFAGAAGRRYAPALCAVARRRLCRSGAGRLRRRRAGGRFASRLCRAAEDAKGDAAPAELLDHPLGAARAQVHETYIVAQTRDGLVIVDQHAAHERIVYEKLKAALEPDGVARQILLIPEIVELDEADVERLTARADELARFGLVLEAFGPGAVALRETPSLLGEIDGAGLVRDLAEHMSEWDETLPLERRLMQVASSMACHGSVRAGRRLKPRGDECAASRDGSHAQFRPMQSRPPDLCGTETHRHRAAVWEALIYPKTVGCVIMDFEALLLALRIVRWRVARDRRLRDDWPSRPITMIVPFAPGGGVDLQARIQAQRMGELLGQPIVVENVRRAAGMAGAARVAKADPDGYTMLIGNSGTHA